MSPVSRRTGGSPTIAPQQLPRDHNVIFHHVLRIRHDRARDIARCRCLRSPVSASAHVNRRALRAGARCAARRRGCRGSWSVLADVALSRSRLFAPSPVSPRLQRALRDSGCAIKFDGFAAWAARAVLAIEDARSILGDSRTSGREHVTRILRSVRRSRRSTQFQEIIMHATQYPRGRHASCPRTTRLRRHQGEAASHLGER